MPFETLELEIHDLARGGAGVGRDASGRIVFVPLTAPGDRVRIRVTEARKNYAQGEVLEVLTPSPRRIEPRCAAFGRCGGCQWQHLPYELQWQTKALGVRHALKRVQVDLPVRFDERPAERIWEYRNRVQARGFQGELGFLAAGSQVRVGVDRCEIARPEINAQWAEVRSEGQVRPRPYKVEIEVDEAGQVHRAWNAGHAARGFRQVHDEQNRALQDWVAEALSPGRRLLDLYGGSGNLSRGLKGAFGEIDCVDVSSPEASSEAGYRFHRSAVRPWLAQHVKNLAGRVDAAILDPPREGLAEDFGGIEAALAGIGVREVIAVGCDPDAWARDVARFVRRGWVIERAGAVDLFPQTPHVESLARLILPSDRTDLEA